MTNIGDSLYFIAAMWLVYDLTNNPLYTGIAGFATQGPAAFQFLAGPLVDRWSIRKTLVSTQLVQAVVISTIPLADHFGMLSAEFVLVVMPVLSALNQLVYPAQTTALPRLLDDDDLVAANSAFSFAYQGLDMVANGLSGVLIALVGAVTMFVLDAVTFGIAALLFATVYVPPADESDSKEGSADAVDADEEDGSTADGESGALQEYLTELRAGMEVLRGTFLVWLFAGVVVVQFVSGIVLSSLPVYADTMVMPDAIDFLGSAGAYGILMGAYAGGVFFGAIGANAVDDRRLGPLMILSYALTGTLWTVAILLDWLPITAVLILLAVIPVGVINVQITAVAQSAPANEYVGRVSSLVGSASTVMLPFGSLAGGVVTAEFGPQIATGLYGISIIGLAAYVLVHPGLRGLPATDRVSLQ